MQYNLKGLSVYLSVPVNGSVPIQTVVSLFSTDAYLRAKGIPCRINFQIGGTLCGARNTAAADFLATDANRFLMIDSDMVWKPEDVIRLLAMSTVMDIVVAPYVTRQEPVAFMIKVADRTHIPLNEHGCAAIDGMGLGFAVVSRRVIEDLTAAAPYINYPTGPALRRLFRFDVMQDGDFQGEDIGFLEDAKAAGYQCWMDTTIELGHVGNKVFTASLLSHARHVDGKLAFGDAA